MQVFKVLGLYNRTLQWTPELRLNERTSPWLVLDLTHLQTTNRCYSEILVFFCAECVRRILAFESHKVKWLTQPFSICPQTLLKPLCRPKFWSQGYCHVLILNPSQFTVLVVDKHIAISCTDLFIFIEENYSG